MALTLFQRDICQLLAQDRKQHGDVPELKQALERGKARFHEGINGGAWPQFK